MNNQKNTIPVALKTNLENMIYFIRGKKVMLDRDLAELYGVATKNLNKAVNRNRSRFPDDFMFEIKKNELVDLKFQIGTLKYYGRRALPKAFTEQGIAMLSSVLNSERAIQINIKIMRAFIRIREISIQQIDFRNKINELENKFLRHDRSIEEHRIHIKNHNEKIAEVFQAINNLIEAPTPVSTEEIIRKGEGQNVEFKSTLRMNLHTQKPDKEIEFAVLKTIAGFLNSEGGTLLIGINDQGEIIGIKNDNFSNRDKMMLHLTHLIKSHIGVQHHQFIRYAVETLKGHEIFRVDCRRAAVPAYLKQDQANLFYIRTGASTALLPVHEIHDYIQNRFHGKK